MNDSPSIYAYISMGLLIGLYLIPALVAWLRQSQHRGAIFILNIVLGWVFPPFGWAAIFLWAAIDTKQPHVMKTVRFDQGG